MKSLRLFWLSPIALLAACATTPPPPDDAPLEEVPEAVAAIADPAQNLSVVRIDPVDGCYWYQYSGPVETTFLPLRTSEGRAICTRAPEPEPEIDLTVERIE
ncbi:hypothetical protein [Nioella nitratireducens]|uniref:hypothetical protein n=1 Tax=Nioella nitratireducens TaxID=1287720 RepID=UPI0008FD8994|nr:hypothetical protein [Nioella nitratireducens]